MLILARRRIIQNYMSNNVMVITLINEFKHFSEKLGIWRLMKNTLKICLIQKQILTKVGKGIKIFCHPHSHIVRQKMSFIEPYLTFSLNRGLRLIFNLFS